MYRLATAGFLLFAATSIALAADAVKMDLEKFKMKGNDELVKFDDGKLCYHCEGTGTATIKVDDDGDYVLTIDASCDEAQKMMAKMTIKLGDKVVSENFELKQTDSKEYTFDIKLKKGENTLSIAFTNDAYKEGEFDRNMYVHGVSYKKK
jgi:hypothetical protein